MAKTSHILLKLSCSSAVNDSCSNLRYNSSDYTDSQTRSTCGECHRPVEVTDGVGHVAERQLETVRDTGGYVDGRTDSQVIEGSEYFIAVESEGSELQYIYGRSDTRLSCTQ